MGANPRMQSPWKKENNVHLHQTRLAVMLSLVIATGASAQDWPQFRGLDGGVAEDTRSLPASWGPDNNVVWKSDIPGRAWSSPIVTGDHVLITSVINTTGAETALKPLRHYQSRSFNGPMTGNDLETPASPMRWVLYDIDFNTGKIRWQQTLHTAVPGSKHEKNSFASETPVTDGKRVYVYLGYVGLFAFDLEGAELWHSAMEVRPMRQGWGTASSPVVHDDRLYVVNDNLAQSFLAAFDATNGQELWRINRDEASNWSTPLIWQNDLRTEIVTTGTGGVRAYNLNGRELWNLTGMSSIHVATPFARHGLLYINSGYTADSARPVYAIQPGASGDISLHENMTQNDYIRWSHPTLGSYNPSALVYGDYHYTLLDRGILICHDARTGAEVYSRTRVSPGGSLFTASPWAYNGKIFAISEEGDTYVMKAGPKFELLGVNSLEEWTLATPAIAHGSLIIRTVNTLYRIAAPL